MPRYLSARPPGDLAEAQHVRRLAHSRHAPADWITHATMVVYSWEGQRVRQIAVELRCHPQTVRDRLHAFNERGLEGLGMKPGSGRKPRLSEQERAGAQHHPGLGASATAGQADLRTDGGTGRARSGG